MMWMWGVGFSVVALRLRAGADEPVAAAAWAGAIPTAAVTATASPIPTTFRSSEPARKRYPTSLDRQWDR